MVATADFTVVAPVLVMVTPYCRYSYSGSLHGCPLDWMLKERLHAGFEIPVVVPEGAADVEEEATELVVADKDEDEDEDEAMVQVVSADTIVVVISPLTT